MAIWAASTRSASPVQGAANIGSSACLTTRTPMVCRSAVSKSRRSRSSLAWSRIKNSGEKFSDRDYAKVRALGDEYMKRFHDTSRLELAWALIERPK